MTYNKNFSNKPFEFNLKHHNILGLEVVNTSLKKYNIDFDFQYRKIDDVGIYHFQPEWAAGFKTYNRNYERYTLTFLLEYEYALNFLLKDNLAMTDYQKIVWAGPGAIFNLWSGMYFSKGQVKLYYTAFSQGNGAAAKGFRGDFSVSIVTYNNFSFDGFISGRNMKDSDSYRRISKGVNLNYSF